MGRRFALPTVRRPSRRAEPPRLQRSVDATPEPARAPNRMPHAEPIARQCAQCEEEGAGVRRQAVDVSHPDDPDEREADRMADAFVRGEGSSGAAAPAPSGSGRLRRQPRVGASPVAGAWSGAMAPLSTSAGRPLARDTRAPYERFFGADLSAVRVHDNQAAARAARSINATAFARGSDVYFGEGRLDTRSTDGRRLLAHELTHVLQPPAATLQRDDDDDEDRIAELRELLDDDEEREALDAMVRLTSAEVKQVLGDGSMRALAVDAFDDEEMVAAIRNMGGPAIPSLRWLFDEGSDYEDWRAWLADEPPGIDDVIEDDSMRDGFVEELNDKEMLSAVKNLPGDLGEKMEWLRAEDVSLAEAKALVDATPRKGERTALYGDNSLRDWFVDICDDIQMQNLVVDLGGSLWNKLQWLRAEGTSWTLLYAVLKTHPAPGDGQAVMDDADLRTFFQQTLDDDQMAQAVELLGGTLSQKMRWLDEEGATNVPADAKKLPTVEPRDAALLAALDGRSELFRRFQVAEAARKNAAMARGGGAGDREGSGEEGREILEEQLKVAEAALAEELQRQGYASEGQFAEEVKNFQAFFTGFALQTAFLMLDENRDIAQKEKGRYDGDDGQAVFDALAPVRKRMPELRAAEKAYEDSLVPGPDDSYKHGPQSQVLLEEKSRVRAELIEQVASLSGTYPVLASPSAQNFVLIHIDNRELLAKSLVSQAASVIEKIDEAREGLAGDSSKVWQLPPVLARAKSALGILEGSALDAMVQRKQAQVQSDKLFTELALAALAIGVGLLSAGTGTVAVLAGAGALGLSAWSAHGHWQQFVFEQAAHGSALDPARALSSVEPSAIWLAVDIAGVFLDAHGLVTAFKAGLGPAARAVSVAQTAAQARKEAEQLEKVAAQVAADGTVGPLLKSDGSLVTVVRKAAQRQVAQKVTLEESPALVEKIRKAAPALADDPAAIAGLVRMGESGLDAALAGFAAQPALLRRLGTIAEAEPAVAAGLLRMRKSVADPAAFEALLRDGLLRRDPRRSQALLSAIGEGRMTDDQLQALARAAGEADPGKRAAAVAEAVEREAKAATDVPLPGSKEELQALDRTRGLDANSIKNPEVDLADEWRVVQGSEPLPLKGDPDYVAEVVLPNGHRWKKGREGGWCRFSTEFCPTPGVLDKLQGKIGASERRIADLGEQAAEAAARERDLPGIIDKLVQNRKPGQRTINVDVLNAQERETLEQTFEVDAEDLTLADLQAGRGRAGSEAAERFAAQEQAILELKDLKRPLYDKLRAASPTERVRQQVLKRAKGLDEVSGALPLSKQLDVDHIVPLAELMNMKGFKDLAWEDQVRIANAIENLKAVDRSANRSRQALSWADEFPGRKQYSAPALAKIQADEAAARGTLQGMIDAAKPKGSP